jgi:hypothetical protein
MSEKIKSDTQLVGAAGEHLVLSRLLARGILAAQAPRGTRKADILVNHLDGAATKPPLQYKQPLRSASYLLLGSRSGQAQEEQVVLENGWKTWDFKRADL